LCRSDVTETAAASALWTLTNTIPDCTDFMAKLYWKRGSHPNIKPLTPSPTIKPLPQSVIAVSSPCFFQ
jgi:hypothetical protein